MKTQGNDDYLCDLQLSNLVEPGVATKRIFAFLDFKDIIDGHYQL